MSWYISYGGRNIAPRYLVNNIVRPGPNRVNRMDRANGSDRALLMGTDYEGSNISFDIWATDLNTRHEQQAAVRDIQGIFSRRDEAPLAFSDDDGLYYMAVPTGAMQPERYLNAVNVHVELALADPIMYGRTCEIVVPSGGSTTFKVGGSYPAQPVIEASAVRNASSLVWGLRLDDGDFMHVKTGSSSARTVKLDCAERTLVLNGDVALPTVDSDWLAFEPGVHTLAMDNGTGAATVTFVERWQ